MTMTGLRTHFWKLKERETRIEKAIEIEKAKRLPSPILSGTEINLLNHLDLVREKLRVMEKAMAILSQILTD